MTFARFRLLELLAVRGAKKENTTRLECDPQTLINM